MESENSSNRGSEMKLPTRVGISSTNQLPALKSRTSLSGSPKQNRFIN